MTPATQRTLLCCALLPQVDAHQAQQLSNNDGAGTLLEEFTARGYFTLRHVDHCYQFHPLFRAFLLARVTDSFAAAELAELQHRAATLLENTGATAAAVELLLAAQFWEPAATLLIRHAPAMLQQGRAHTLEKWLRALPAHYLALQPWAQYWLGMCRLACVPLDARPHFESAFAVFAAIGDTAGLYQAWAAIVDTFIYDWGDFAPLDRWIAIMDDRLAHAPAWPDTDVEARVTCGMFAALTWRQPQRTDLPLWAERVMHLVLASDNVALKMALGSHVLIYFLWMGDFSRATVIIDALRPYSSAGDNTPLTQMHWWVMLAMYSWFTADHRGCLAAITAGERLAEDSGVHLLDLYLLAQGVYSGLSQDDPDGAARLLEKMATLGSPRLMDKSLYHYQAASVLWHRGDLRLARQHGEAAIELARATGSPLPVALTGVELAFTLFELGESQAADAALAQGAAAGRGMKHIEFMYGLYAAYFALRNGKRAAAVDSLRPALQLGAREGYVNTPRWNPMVVTPLCALALEHDIEPDYVRDLIRRRGLEASAECAHLETWPWTVRIRTLGEFSVQVNDRPLDLAKGDRRRPAELLKLLIASGGRQVSMARLSDILWPDADGDAAYQSLHTTLHRLRKLLGKDVVRSAAGAVSLNDALVWLDVWTVEPLLQRLEAALSRDMEPAVLHTAAQPLMEHYRGDLFSSTDDAAWTHIERDHLRERVRRVVETLGHRLEAAEQWAAALELYHWGIEHVAPTSETLYLGAMRAHHHLDQPAEVARTYQRCVATLQAVLAAPPSPALEQLYLSL